MASYTPGTYTGKGYGVRGKVILEVTFSEDRITDIKIVKHKEIYGQAYGLLNITFLRLSSISRWQFLWWWERKWCAALSCMRSPHA